MGEYDSDTTKAETDPGSGDYGEEGVGNNSQPFIEATRAGRFPNDNTGANRSQGETPGAGSIYAAMLNERPNISSNRNSGPDRAPSRSGSTPIMVQNMGGRRTGRV